MWLTTNEWAALTWLQRDEEHGLDIAEGGLGNGYVSPGHRLRPYFDTLRTRGLVKLLPGCNDSFGFTKAGRDALNKFVRRPV